MQPTKTSPVEGWTPDPVRGDGGFVVAEETETAFLKAMNKAWF
jgi:hypothetical protein